MKFPDRDPLVSLKDALAKAEIARMLDRLKEEPQDLSGNFTLCSEDVYEILEVFAVNLLEKYDDAIHSEIRLIKMDWERRTRRIDLRAFRPLKIEDIAK